MCGDPITMTALALASGYLQYKSIGQQADAQEAAYKAQAEQAESNRIIEEGRSKQIAQKYADEQLKLDEHRRAVIGHNIAEQGGSGMTAGTGSGLDMLVSNDNKYRENSIKMLANQRFDTTDSWIRQADFINQRRSALSAADNVQSQAKLSKLGTIIGTAASVGGIWNKWGSSGSGAGDMQTVGPSISFPKQKTAPWKRGWA